MKNDRPHLKFKNGFWFAIDTFGYPYVMYAAAYLWCSNMNERNRREG